MMTFVMCEIDPFYWNRMFSVVMYLRRDWGTKNLRKSFR